MDFKKQPCKKRRGRMKNGGGNGIAAQTASLSNILNPSAAAIAAGFNSNPCKVLILIRAKASIDMDFKKQPCKKRRGRMKNADFREPKKEIGESKNGVVAVLLLLQFCCNCNKNCCSFLSLLPKFSLN